MCVPSRLTYPRAWGRLVAGCGRAAPCGAALACCRRASGWHDGHVDQVRAVDEAVKVVVKRLLTMSSAASGALMGPTMCPPASSTCLQERGRRPPAADGSKTMAGQLVQRGGGAGRRASRPCSLTHEQQTHTRQTDRQQHTVVRQQQQCTRPNHTHGRTAGTNEDGGDAHPAASQPAGHEVDGDQQSPPTCWLAGWLVRLMSSIGGVAAPADADQPRAPPPPRPRRRGVWRAAQQQETAENETRPHGVWWSVVQPSHGSRRAPAHGAATLRAPCPSFRTMPSRPFKTAYGLRQTLVTLQGTTTQARHVRLYSTGGGGVP